MKKKSPLSSFLFIGILIIFIYYLSQWYYQSQIDKKLKPSQENQIIFEIQAGENAKIIGQKLKENKLIKSSFIFYLYLKNNKLDRQIKTGKFVIANNLSIKDIIEIITKSTSDQIVLTFPEGLTIKQIDEKLKQNNLIQKNQFSNYNKNYDFKNSPYHFLINQKSLEGFLFPDTYFVSPNIFTIESFTKKLLDNYSKKTKDLNLSYDELIMASIIEKEVMLEQDLHLVSGILWKRLKNDWPIQADATLLYIKDNNTITHQDLQSNSPYNTRNKRGLPPTPICNPGIRAIKASLNPTSSDYWFYLNTADTGEAIYASSNEQHNINRQKYL